MHVQTEVVVLLIKLIVFLKFSLPSASLDLKVPIITREHPCICLDLKRDTTINYEKSWLLNVIVKSNKECC